MKLQQQVSGCQLVTHIHKNRSKEVPLGPHQKWHPVYIAPQYEEKGEGRTGALTEAAKPTKQHQVPAETTVSGLSPELMKITNKCQALLRETKFCHEVFTPVEKKKNVYQRYNKVTTAEMGSLWTSMEKAGAGLEFIKCPQQCPWPPEKLNKEEQYTMSINM